MDLDIRQRFFAATIYLLIILLLGLVITGDLLFIYDPSGIWNALFLATAVAVILGSYVVEPFFTRPVEVIARWIAVLLFLLGLDNQEEFLLYSYWIIAALSFIVIALSLILLHESPKFPKARKALTDIICKISRPEFVFSVLYFFIIGSFLTDNVPELEFALLIGFGFLLLINKPVNGLTKWVWKISAFLKSSRNAGRDLGYIIGHDSLDFYKVEVTGDLLKDTASIKGELVYLENGRKGIIGIVVDEKYLVGKRWISVFSLRGKSNEFLTQLSHLRNSGNYSSISC